MKTINVYFTGHRPNKLPGGYNMSLDKNLLLIQSIESEIEKLLMDYDSVHMITGMALGFDQLAAIAGIRLKKKDLPITIEAAIPCLNQENKWPQKSQDNYNKILMNVDIKTFVSEDTYTIYCMEVRNRYMVDNGDICIAYHDGTKGGTGNCIKYSIKKEKEIINLYKNSEED